MPYIHANNKYHPVQIQQLLSTLSSQDHIIAIDFDGVFTDPHHMKAAEINKRGYTITAGQTDGRFCIGSACVKQEDYEQASHRVLTELLHHVPLAPHVKEVLARLKSLPQAKVFIVTGRHDSMMGGVISYLEAHELRVDGVINTKNASKKQALIDLGAHLFVEDTPIRVYDLFEDEDCTLLSPGLRCDVYLFRHIANTFEEKPRGSVGLVLDWQDLYRKAHSQSQQLLGHD